MSGMWMMRSEYCTTHSPRSSASVSATPTISGGSFGTRLTGTSCCSALVDGQFAGLLTFRTDSQEFYHLNMGTLFTRFSPLRAIRMLLNLLLLADGTKGDEFVVDSLAVDPACRGRGVGTALLRKAEERARSIGKRMMSLGVIGENEGAIRLYERLGYRRTRTWDGHLVRLATGSAGVHRMEKRLGESRVG